MNSGIKQWWRRQSHNTKFPLITVITLLVAKVVVWLLEQTLTFAYEKLLEGSVTTERAASLQTRASSALAHISRVLGSEYTVGATIALAIMVLWPHFLRAIKTALAIAQFGFATAIARAGKNRQIAEMARDALRLARKCANHAAYARGASALPHPLMGRPDLTEEESNDLWRKYTEELSHNFVKAMDAFRSDLYLQVRPLIVRLKDLGYVEYPRSLDHVTNAFCIDELANSLAEGAETAFRDLSSRGFDIDEYRAEALK